MCTSTPFCYSVSVASRWVLTHSAATSFCLTPAKCQGIIAVLLSAMSKCEQLLRSRQFKSQFWLISEIHRLVDSWLKGFWVFLSLSMLSKSTEIKVRCAYKSWDQFKFACRGLILILRWIWICQILYVCVCVYTVECNNRLSSWGLMTMSISKGTKPKINQANDKYMVCQCSLPAETFLFPLSFHVCQASWRVCRVTAFLRSH